MERKGKEVVQRYPCARLQLGRHNRTKPVQRTYRITEIAAERLLLREVQDRKLASGICAGKSEEDDVLGVHAVKTRTRAPLHANDANSLLKV